MTLIFVILYLLEENWIRKGVEQREPPLGMEEKSRDVTRYMAIIYYSLLQYKSDCIKVQITNCKKKVRKNTEPSALEYVYEFNFK